MTAADRPPATLEVLVGPPGSGKSTYARSRAAQGAVVVCNDDLLRMYHGGHGYEPAFRVAYVRARRALVRVWLDAGVDVVVDMTNCVRAARRQWADLAAEYGCRAVASVFPAASPEEYAARRHADDPRGETPARWVDLCRTMAASLDAEPVDGALEGFQEVWQIDPAACVEPPGVEGGR